eukprot:TRINITY_DN4519_c0_g1_i6.p1 TRINITY_DN4519_c0_g1~~TRINITY_DN4519_c0_g1_i6.p1  ORF type:complete len:816 (+),score=280.99 TRINITY_DN4519_c0_g1_i6:83-2530(+)
MSQEISSVLQWLELFHKSCSQAGELTDGVVLFEVLHELDPDHFDLSSLSRDCGDNLLLKIGNVKKLVSSVETFLRDEVGLPYADLSFINISTLARGSETTELLKLLQMILLCAVKSLNKEIAIQNIMLMEETAQADLMMMINAATSRLSRPASNFMSPSLASPQFASPLPSPPPAAQPQEEEAGLRHLPMSESAIKQMAADRLDLQQQIDALVRENRELRLAKSSLSEQVNELEASRESCLLAAIESVRREQESIRHNEVHRHRKLAEKAEAAAKENEDLLLKTKEELDKLRQQQQQQAQVVEQKMRALQEEVDNSREKVKQVAVLEATLYRYKQKLDETAELKKRLKDSEEQQAEQTQKILALEQEVAKVNPLKAQLQKYKDQLIQYEAQLLEMQNQDEQRIQEIDRLKLVSDQRQRDIDHLSQLLHSTRHELTTLQETHHTPQHIPQHDLEESSVSSGSVSMSDMLTPVLEEEAAEKIQRLEAENNTLRSHQVRLSQLEDELDLANRRYDTLANTSQRSIQELRSQVRHLEDELASTSGSAAARNVAVDRLQEQLDQERQQHVQVQQRLQQQSQLVQQVQAQLHALQQQHADLLDQQLHQQQQYQTNASQNSAQIDALHQHLRDNQHKLQEANIMSQKLEKLAMDQAEMNTSLQQENEHLKQSLQTLNKTYLQTKEQLETARVREEKLKQKAQRMSEQINTSNEQLKRSNEEYTKSVEQMTKTLASGYKLKYDRTILGYEKAITSLQSQLKEKEEEVRITNKLRLEAKEASKREERLMSAAFYEIGMELTLLNMQRRQHTGNSWLNRQRTKLN